MGRLMRLLLLLQLACGALALGSDVLGGGLDMKAKSSGFNQVDAQQRVAPDACVRLKAVKLGQKGPIPVTAGKLVKLRFQIQYPSANKTAPAYTYVLRLDTPPKLEYLAATSTPKLRSISFDPVVGDNMLVWEIVGIPGRLSKLTLTITFRVDPCADTPLRFKALGFRDVDDDIQCETLLVLPHIPVVRDPMISCNTTTVTNAPSTNLPPGAPVYQPYGPPGTRCIERGSDPNLVNPTLDECFVACSLLVEQQPMFINYVPDAQGNAQCRCLSNQCTLVYIGGQRQRTRRSLLQTKLRKDAFGNGHTESATDRRAEAVRAMNSYGAYQILVLATRSPTASPTATPTQQPTVAPTLRPTILPTMRPTVTPTQAPTFDCLVPEIFNKHRFECEGKFCKPFMYRIPYLNLSASFLDDPTPYDVCRLTCSALELGDEGNAETVETRAQCQQRCQEVDYNSFMCQAYCTDFPDDTFCPRHGCDSLSSMRRNLEYCSQQVCDKYFPVLGAPLSPKNQTIYELCEDTCSAQQLGPLGTVATLNQRQRCREMCAVDGIERSLMCLNYCLSFPTDDSVCPPPEVVADMVRRKTYTAPPTPVPSLSPTTPTVQCLVTSVFKDHAIFCDQTLCSGLLWRLPYLNETEQTEYGPTATTICQSICSILALGPIERDANGTIVVSPQRALCQGRCHADGYDSFLCQHYCLEFPDDPVCPKPSCTSLESVEANLEYCDRERCSALYPPADYALLTARDKEEEIRLCKLPCSAQQLGRADDATIYEVTLAMRNRCRARCEIDGPERSVMCLSYCMSFPDDDVCAPPATVANIASSALAAPDCYIPDVFAQNMAYCESQLCRPLNWRQNLAYSNATSDPQAYDVCSWACSAQSVGLMPGNETARVRESCRDRCRTDGVESFVCRRYCSVFPNDPACPKPDCRTYESIERDPEYCDQTACVNYLPGSEPVFTLEQSLQQNVCNLACSRQRLGDLDNIDTTAMRGHCQNLCELQGPANSLLCLSYCTSYPEDPFCPGSDEIARIRNQTASPTPSPTATPFEQKATPLLANYTGGVPIPAISQLELGYNPLLGLMPHEQLGIYTRHPIFQFHVDPLNRFVLQQGQGGGTKEFIAPIEYYITPELADCTYSSTTRSTVSVTREEYMEGITTTTAWGLADIDVNGGVKTTKPEKKESKFAPAPAPAGAPGPFRPPQGGDDPAAGGEIELQPIRNRRRLGDPPVPTQENSVSLSTKLSVTVGNSKAAQTGRMYESKGQTQSTTTTLKRRYYRAGLRLDRFTANSFAPAFKADAKSLVDGPYSFNKTITFVSKYGAYIYDGATLGASLWRSYFFTSDVTANEIADVQSSSDFEDENVLVKHQNDQGTTITHKTAAGTQITYSFTDVERVGEFNTGSGSQDQVYQEESCAIGATIAPQIIEYALKPLWDTDIPLEMFMTIDEANAFRTYLWNATTTQMATGESCLNEDGAACYGEGGICLPKYNPDTSTYSFTCENPARAGMINTYDFQIVIFGLEIAEYLRIDSRGYIPSVWGSHMDNLRPSDRPISSPPPPFQYGLFGHNLAKIYLDSKDPQSFREYCPHELGSNYWSGGNPLCPSTNPNNFTINFANSDKKEFRIELYSVATRGVIPAESCKPGPVSGPISNPDIGSPFNLDKKDGDINVITYSQPSMGVAVCPSQIGLDGVARPLEDCYYIFRYAIGLDSPPQYQLGSGDGRKISYIPWLDARSKDSEDKWRSPVWAATTDAQPETKRLSLSFDLVRDSKRPVSVRVEMGDISGTPYIEKGVRLAYNNEDTIKRWDLQARVDLGMRTFLELGRTAGSAPPTALPTSRPTSVPNTAPSPVPATGSPTL